VNATQTQAKTVVGKFQTGKRICHILIGPRESAKVWEQNKKYINSPSVQTIFSRLWGRGKGKS
jgi:hypothetical protein